MALIEDVQSMQSQGMSEDQIIQLMRQRGMKYKDIADALSQTKIKSAIEQPAQDPSYNVREESDMQASIMNQQAPMPGQEAQMQYSQQQAPVPMPAQEYAYSPQYEQQQQYPQQYQGVSSEVITEISEQVVTEKLSEIRKYLEKVIDIRSMLEAKIESMDERLKRIEKTIDILQSSILRKVGDYVTNVQDIKNELIETQKTFSKLLPRNAKHEPEHQKSH
ncbi:MAG: hypothetical protein AABW79_01995 [Nanoarchaeota archaeon]